MEVKAKKAEPSKQPPDQAQDYYYRDKEPLKEIFKRLVGKP